MSHRRMQHRLFLAILCLVLAVAGEAKADFIGDTVIVQLFSQPFGIDVTASAVVVSPGVEFDNFGHFNSPQFDINIEGSSIEIVNNAFFGGSLENTFLLFTSLDASSPEAVITGFTPDVSPALASYFGPDRITFGADFIRVSFAGDNGNRGFQAGDRIMINLQLTPRAVPEPTSLSMLAVGTLGATGYGWRRRRANRA